MLVVLSNQNYKESFAARQPFPVVESGKVQLMIVI